MKLSTAISVCFVAGLSGCAGEHVRLDDEPATGEVAQGIADANDIAYACGHAQAPTSGVPLGVMPTATASASSPVVLVKDAYDLTLTGGQGWLKFTTDDEAEYGIFTDPKLTPESVSTGVCVKKANTSETGTVGGCLSPAYVAAISATTCPANPLLPTFDTPDNALSYVRTYNLVAGQAYFVQFRRADGAHVYASFENLGEQ